MVLKVQMPCEKCRTKALKIAAATQGVNEVAIQGAERDRLMVIGEEIDSVKLTRSLRKKLRYATIVSVEVKKDGKKEDKNDEKTPMVYVCHPEYVQLADQYPYQATACSIM
ncbi:hypothetical protein PTKIN_Ptkin14bG0002400 [Pterospermum kingtungense]